MQHGIMVVVVFNYKWSHCGEMKHIVTVNKVTDYMEFQRVGNISDNVSPQLNKIYGIGFFSNFNTNAEILHYIITILSLCLYISMANTSTKWIN